MAFIRNYYNEFTDLMDRTGDPRTRNWLFMSSPLPTLGICLSYVYIVKVLGPKLMENRKPFELRNVLIYYNLFQVIFSFWLFYELPPPDPQPGRRYTKWKISIPPTVTFYFFWVVDPPGHYMIVDYIAEVKEKHLKFINLCLMGGWWGQYSFRCQPVDYSSSPTAIRIGMSGWLTGHYSYSCQPVDYSNHPETLRMVHACWWYYFSKFTEFFDTFFFVLRKKNQHISTLHVIHHGVMPMSVWFGVKFTPGGHSTFFGLCNTFVHIIMYTYYLIAALGPQYQKYLWWKKYLTAFQMVQFIAIMVHAFQLLFIDCNYPKAFVWWIGMHAVMFYFLFSQFYKESYTSKKNKAKKHSVESREKTNEKNSTTSAITNGSAKSERKRDASDYYITPDEVRQRTQHLSDN